MIWYSIEHPTRGMFKEMDYDVVTGDPKPRFSINANRNDEIVEKFNTVRQAREMIEKMPPKIGSQCYILVLEKGFGERYADVRRLL